MNVLCRCLGLLASTSVPGGLRHILADHLAQLVLQLLRLLLDDVGHGLLLRNENVPLRLLVLRSFLFFVPRRIWYHRNAQGVR